MKTVLAIAAAAVLFSATAAYAQLQAIDPRTGKAPEPVVKPVPKPTPKPIAKTDGTCGDFGTTVDFEDSPKEAAVRAKKEEKLVFVLHVSGNFEDPRFT